MKKEGKVGMGSAFGIWGPVGSFTEKRAVWIVIGTIAVTLLLILPILAMSPEKWASGEPDGEVFDIGDTIEERLPPADLYTSFILESRNGDALSQQVLWELYQNEEALRNSRLGRKYLSSHYSVDLNTWSTGIYTIADAIHYFMLGYFQKGLGDATDDEVKFAIHLLLLDEQTEGLRDTFSVKATSERREVLGMMIDYWTSPALILNTLSNNPLIESDFGKEMNLSSGLEDYVIKEHYNREVQDLLRGDQQTYRLWGIAIDLSIESEEESMLSFPLIFAAVVLILIIITFIFRSGRVLLLTFFGIGMLLIWLFGLNNLVGLNRSLTIMILVPVSILVLGVDYAIHSLHRYEEERAKAGEPGKSLGISIAGVGGALFLAMVTTVVAFGSNVISEIEEIIGFGVSAAMAIFSAFWIMGFFVPAAKMLWDRRKFKKQTLRPGKEKEGAGSKLLSRVVVGLADRRYFVLPVVLVLSIGAGYLAVQLDARLDVKEYFDNSSDFVISLDKLDEHVAEKGGEPAVIYIEGDLTDPEVLDTMKELEASFSDNENIARNPFTGEVLIYPDPFHFLEQVLEHNYTINAIQAAYPGVNITDNDNNSIPDTREQMEVVLEYIYESGIPLNRTTMMYEIDQVREVIWRDPDNHGRYATIVMTGVPDTRELATVQASEKEYRKDMEVLGGVEGITYYGLTGSGYERDATLTAITDSLSFSIIVAVVLCFIVLVILFRSFKYALVTVIPEILVAAWLYALMFLGGYHLNAVTATIAAISIGVGIDYSVHVTARFRQELARYEGKRREALDHAAKHSGIALLGSAASTMFGFAIIGFAPMPMFSSYGILTALMILMAFVAALLVLPSLLFIVTREKKGDEESKVDDVNIKDKGN